MNNITENLRKELISNSDEKTRESGERFFKEDVKLYGIKTAVVTQIAKTFYKDIPDKNRKNVFELCETLFFSGIIEESFVACNWSYNVRRLKATGDRHQADTRDRKKR